MELDFLLGLDVNRVGVDLVRHRGGAGGLLRCCMLIGLGLPVFHTVLEALDRTAQIRANVFELFGSKHQNDDQQNDQPMPYRK